MVSTFRKSTLKQCLGWAGWCLLAGAGWAAPLGSLAPLRTLGPPWGLWARSPTSATDIATVFCIWIVATCSRGYPTSAADPAKPSG